MPKTILDPVNAWSDANKYHEQAQDLINQFEENFKKFGSEVEHIAEKVHSINKYFQLKRVRRLSHPF